MKNRKERRLEEKYMRHSEQATREQSIRKNNLEMFQLRQLNLNKRLDGVRSNTLKRKCAEII